MAFQLESTAFKPSDFIPKKFAKEGNDISPPLKWTDAPSGTKEFVLMCEDPDAPTQDPFVHWVAYKIPGHAKELPEGLPKAADVKGPIHFLQGMNSYGDVGYGGPMPPRRDKPHHYHFRLFALDTEIESDSTADKDTLERSMKGHVLAETEIVGLYQRS